MSEQAPAASEEAPTLSLEQRRQNIIGLQLLTRQAITRGDTRVEVKAASLADFCVEALGLLALAEQGDVDTDLARENATLRAELEEARAVPTDAPNPSEDVQEAPDPEGQRVPPTEALALLDDLDQVAASLRAELTSPA